MSICVYRVHWFKFTETIIRMKQTVIYNEQQTRILVLWWHICRCHGVPVLVWYFHNESQLVKVAFIHIQESHSSLDYRSQLHQKFNCRPGTPWEQKKQLSHEYPSHDSVSNTLGCGLWGVSDLQWYASKRWDFTSYMCAHVSYSDKSSQHCIHWLHY